MFDEQPDGDPHGECAAAIHRLQADIEYVRDLLWHEQPECCGSPHVVCRGDRQEQECCGCPVPVPLNDAQIVASLRARFHEVLPWEPVHESAPPATHAGQRRPEGDWADDCWPGGSECAECGCIFIGDETRSKCKVCADLSRARGEAKEDGDG